MLNNNLLITENFNKFIDHTILKPECKEEDIVHLCKEAKEYEFAAVCVNPYWVPLAKSLLEGEDIGVATVVGFPLGATLPEVKQKEAEEAIKLGATEIDMVINVGALKSKKYDLVKEDIEMVVDICKDKAIIK